MPMLGTTHDRKKKQRDREHEGCKSLVNGAIRRSPRQIQLKIQYIVLVANADGGQATAVEMIRRELDVASAHPSLLL